MVLEISSCLRFYRIRIELENTQIQLIGSATAPERAFAWVESIKAVIGGINIFGTGLHLWMAESATDKDKQKWLQVLHTIADLNPEIVIPAHQRDNSELNINSVHYVKQYIENYIMALRESKDSGELIGKMKDLYP